MPESDSPTIYTSDFFGLSASLIGLKIFADVFAKFKGAADMAANGAVDELRCVF